MKLKTYSLARRTLRGFLTCSASLAALGLGAGPAQAQDDTAAADAGTEPAPIVVTGSRLIQTGMDTPVPVTAVQADELKKMDPSGLVASVSQLPQFYNNQTPNSSNFFQRGGTGNLNLRGLGINRTLTLLNGRRMPSSSAFGGVDINLFPKAMIKNIETVTGGASAAYGTDAVAGVVNFILDTDYTGFEADLQGGITSRGDGKNYSASLSFGAPIGDRGHFLVSAERAEQDGIHNYKGRDWYKGWGTLVQNGMIKFYPHVTSTAASFDGIIFAPGTAINGYAFDRNGNAAPFDLGSISQGAIGAPGSRQVADANSSGDDLQSEVYTLYPDTDRYSIFAYADYEVADGFTMFAQYIRGYNHQFQYNAPRGGFGGTPTTLTIFQDNAYLPDDLRQTMVDNDIQSFVLRHMGSIEDVGQMSFEDWTTQNIGTVGFNTEIGGGGFMDGWQIDGFYQYGHSKRVWDQLGLRVDRIFAAVDAVDDGTGNIVCRVSTYAGGAEAFPGCEPINLFGRGNASAAAVDYVVGQDVGQHVSTPLYFADSGFSLGLSDEYDAKQAKSATTTFVQHLAEVSARGNVFDGWAGPVALAFGASYRKESILQIVRDVTNQASDHDHYKPVKCNDPSIGLRGVSAPDCNNSVGQQYSKVSNIKGDAEVKEVFAETLVPLVRDVPWMQSAVFNAAGRWADYSGSGEIWAYKFGLDLAFSDAIRLRGTYSRDVRAGNLSERFDKTGGTAVIDDPRTPQNDNLTITRFGGGNPSIRPEKADTFTAGVVLQPLSGLSASVDWYKVKIKDVIAPITEQQVVNNCFLENQQEFCDLVSLDPNTDAITLVGAPFINIARWQVSGVDAEIAYRSRLHLFGGDESVSARAFASWLIERSENDTDYAGMTGYRQSDQVAFSYPDFKLTANLTYNNGPFSAFLQGRYIGPGIQDVTQIEGTTIEDNSVDSVLYTDVTLSYDLDLAGGTLEVFGTVTNLFDTDPPITPTYSAFLAYAQQTNPGVYDVLGRRFTLGVKFKM